MSYRSPTRGLLSAPLLASFCAGPIFLAALALSDKSPDRGWAAALATLTLFPVTIPFGFAFALIPTLVGTLVLHLLGRVVTIVRWWPLWGVAGALLAWAVVSPANQLADDNLPWLLTGGACALICRARVGWP